MTILVITDILVLVSVSVFAFSPIACCGCLLISLLVQRHLVRHYSNKASAYRSIAKFYLNLFSGGKHHENI